MKLIECNTFYYILKLVNQSDFNKRPGYLIELFNLIIFGLAMLIGLLSTNARCISKFSVDIFTGPTPC